MNALNDSDFKEVSQGWQQLDQSNLSDSIIDFLHLEVNEKVFFLRLMMTYYIYWLYHRIIFRPGSPSVCKVANSPFQYWLARLLSSGRPRFSCQ
jgi:hypothetical protein